MERSIEERGIEFLRAAFGWFLHTETGHAFGIVLVLGYLLGWWRIFSRAGYPGSLAILMLVPPLALALWAFLAFAPWPARRELAALRKVQRVVHQAERRRWIA
jgi:hypothetical protein